MLILVVILTVIICAIWGFYKGFFRLLLRLSVLILAYVATWQETPHLAAYLSSQGWLQGLQVWPVAGMAIFLGSSVVFSLLARFFVYVAPEDWLVSGKFTGAAVGAMLGCGAGLLLVWTIGMLQDAWYLRTAQTGQNNPVVNSSFPVEPSKSGTDVAERFIRDLSGEAVAAVAQGALGESPAAEVATRWIREPMSVNSGLQHLAAKPELRALFENPASFAVLVNGENSEIQRLPAFQAVTDDPEIMPFLSAIGLPGETLPDQSRELASLLSRYARNFEKLRTTPEFQSLAQNADLREKLRQGNLMVLLTDEKMRRLAEMLAHGDQLDGMPLTKAGDEAEKTPLQQLPSDRETVPPKPLYRWKDSSGHLYITEEKPPEGVQADVIQP